MSKKQVANQFNQTAEEWRIAFREGMKERDDEIKRLVKNIGHTLRSMRKAANLSLVEVKNITDIPVATLSDIERGIVAPSSEGVTTLMYTYTWEHRRQIRRISLENAALREAMKAKVGDDR